MQENIYKKDDVIYYPMHGVGNVDAVEERNSQEGTTIYYVLVFLNEGIKIMVPIDNAKSSGLRKIICKEDAQTLYDHLKDYDEGDDLNWNVRYKNNLAKLRSGEAKSVCQVVKSLSVREKKRSLSAGEKKMLINAKRILVSEIACATQGEEDEVTEVVNSCIG